MKRILLSTITLMALGFSTNAQNVNIPDANFKAYLLGDATININLDTEIQVSEASAFTGQIWCSSLGIVDMTGLEAFTSLNSLICYDNLITTLDLSSNTALTNLFCSDNPLLSLDLSSNTALYSLVCQNNGLTTLDLSTNTALFSVSCHNNLITSLDVSLNTALTSLGSVNNAIANLNVKNGNNINFTFFNATNNPGLTCIEVDDVAYSNANWPNIDAGSSFSLDCSGGVGINELDSDKIVVYPNPTSSQITIQSEYKIVQVKVFNSIGSLVQTEYSESFSVENLPTGIYVINMITSDGIIRSRFVKE